MIRICVHCNHQKINEVIIKGHALYDDFGKDIVCAAVSSTYLCTINAIYALNENSISVVDGENQHVVRVVVDDNVVQVLLQNMIRCFKSLEKQYPKNIILDKEEE